MRTIRVLLFLTLGLLFLIPGSAKAGWGVGVRFGYPYHYYHPGFRFFVGLPPVYVGFGGPAYYYPPPAYVVPAPVYVQPPPVVYPAPAVAAPTPSLPPTPVPVQPQPANPR
jgi:hypothetical protein